MACNLLLVLVKGDDLLRVALGVVGESVPSSVGLSLGVAPCDLAVYSSNLHLVPCSIWLCATPATCRSPDATLPWAAPFVLVPTS